MAERGRIAQSVGREEGEGLVTDVLVPGQRFWVYEARRCGESRAGPYPPAGVEIVSAKIAAWRARLRIGIRSTAFLQLLKSVDYVGGLPLC